MRKVSASEFMTLDGVVQSPSSPAEDPSGGFSRGGWHVPPAGDPVFQKWMMGSIAAAGGFLLGRGTYEIIAAHWPSASPEEQVLAEPLNTRPKYVASTSLAEPLAWRNSTLLQGDVAQAVRALKEQPGGDLLAIGSPQLVQTLLEHDVIDELRVMIDPVIVGEGKRLFREGALHTLRLVDSQVTGTGAIIATYARAGD
jgi:dihydrofolate reductase